MLLLLGYGHVVLGLIMIMRMSSYALIESYRSQYCRVALFATPDSNHSMVKVYDLLNIYRVLATNKDVPFRGNQADPGGISVIGLVDTNSLGSTDMRLDRHKAGRKRLKIPETMAKTFTDYAYKNKGVGMKGFKSVDSNRNLNTTTTVSANSSTSQSSTIKDGIVRHSGTNKWPDDVSPERNIHASDKLWNQEMRIRSAPTENGVSLCKWTLIEISSDENSLIQLIVAFGHDGETPAIVHGAEPKHNANCSEEGVLVGNDKHRIGLAIPTSYKLCFTQMRSWVEIVSRSPYLWIILPETLNTSLLHMQYTAKHAKICNADEFECSPVQCVNRSVICDTQNDCHNGRDEYCDNAIEPSDMLTYPCFQCADGSCIHPNLPIYSPDYGRKLWYLCNNFPHCLDATDERRDICMMLKGRENALHECLVNNRSVLIWKQNICDGIQNCDTVDDKDVTDSLCKPDKEKVPGKPIDPLVSLVPVCALLLLVAGTMFMRIYFKRQRKNFGDSTELVRAGPAEDEESSYTFINIDTGHHRRNNHTCISIIAEEDSDKECDEDPRQDVEESHQHIGSSEQCIDYSETDPSEDANPWRPAGAQTIEEQSGTGSSCTPERVEMAIFVFEHQTSV